MILWTEDRLTQLRDLWSRGYSATQISRRMANVTRNAVIGAMHRHGVGDRSMKGKPTHRDTVRRIITKALAPTTPTITKRIPVQPPTIPIPFIDLGPGELSIPIMGVRAWHTALAGLRVPDADWGIVLRGALEGDAQCPLAAEQEPPHHIPVPGLRPTSCSPPTPSASS